MPKKLIIFCDGTWNEPTKRGTNVLRMLQATEFKDAKGDPQLVHYIAGVGTRKDEKFRGGTFGLGISNNITDAYSFIVSNYEEGDEIFLFGFSRGAFTARSIAGLIHNLGVLHRCNLPLVAEAYKHYKDKTPDWSPKGKEADKYRRENCHSWPTKIKLLGVWDTVGALGAPYGEILGYLVDKVFKCSFHDLELSESVDSAYHAMAADERRWPFRPTPIELTAYHEERNRANRAEFGFSLYEQKWFPGVHSNVGGGYDRLGLSDCALEWMAECVASEFCAQRKGEFTSPPRGASISKFAKGNNPVTARRLFGSADSGGPARLVLLGSRRTTRRARGRYQRRSLGPSAAPARVHKVIVPPYHRAKKGIESSTQWSA